MFVYVDFFSYVKYAYKININILNINVCFFSSNFKGFRDAVRAHTDVHTDKGGKNEKVFNTTKIKKML